MSSAPPFRWCCGPQTFLANARDVAGLHAFVTRAGAALRQHQGADGRSSPAIAIQSFRPTSMRALSLRSCRSSKLVVLEGVGHMPHHVASDRVVAAIDELATEATLAAR